MKGAYYNEFDPFAAEWLRRLIDAGQIAPGEVDERDLWDVNPARVFARALGIEETLKFDGTTLEIG